MTQSKTAFASIAESPDVQDRLATFHPDAAKILDQLRPGCPDLVDYLLTSIYGFAYARPTLDIRTRHLITLGVLCALGDCKPQLEFQFEAALNLKIPADEIREVFIQTAVFAGNARAINAAMIFDKVFTEWSRQHV